MNSRLRALRSSRMAASFALSLFFMGTASGAGAKISGTVTDKATGEPLPGAGVFIEHVWKGGVPVDPEFAKGAAASLDGHYFILNVSPGIYDLRVDMIGYQSIIKEQVYVTIDRTIVVDFEMSASILEGQVVTVTAEREVIKADVSATQEIISTERLVNTPTLRIDEFVSSIKGVDLVADEDGHGVSVRGGSIRETDVRIDGISVRDPRSENAYLSFNSTSIEELQVMTSGFDARYGGLRSGLINAVTKEGNRNRYTLNLKFDSTPGSERKFFGENPWSEDFLIWKIYADTSASGWAYIGTKDDTSGLIPEELMSFRGWDFGGAGRKNYEPIGLSGVKLSAEQKRQLWMIQHPNYEFAQQPDAYLEGTLTGPLPGKRIPLLGAWLGKSTFLMGAKYENTQFAFPIGPRDAYTDWNIQTKITTAINDKTKLTLNGLYAEVLTTTGNRPSSLGGALIDNSSRFSFLSSTARSVEQQARILGSGDGFTNMYNRSRLQYYDQRKLLGGVKLTHAFSDRSYVESELKFSYSDNTITPFSGDTSRTDAWVMIDSFQVINYPEIGTPNGSTNMMQDLENLFLIYGGLQHSDSSYSISTQFSTNWKMQYTKHHEVSAGLDFRMLYTSVNSGTWFQSEISWTPDIWQFYTIRPLEIGAYLQDKLEFDGMIANIGLRMDYFNPRKKAYTIEHPLDEDYANFYNLTYTYLPGSFGSWERWLEFRELLDDPPGWPEEENPVQIKLSPRLGVSFPVTINSKLYFNYGHFYQRPNVNFLYNIAVGPAHAQVPAPELDMALTTAYEFGFEQRLFRQFLFSTSFYYKDIKNEPLQRTYIDYWQEFQVSTYEPDAYADIRGVELRLEKTLGRFLTFWGSYEYMLRSYGQSGISKDYENQLVAQNQLRSPNITTLTPIPKANLDVSFHTPAKWGFRVLGMRPLSGLVVNTMLSWRDGGEYLAKQDPYTGEEWKVDIVDYYNLDLRASKALAYKRLKAELVLTVENLLDQKRLYISGMSVTQFTRYKESLKFPYEEGEEHGDDKWGEWDKEHIDLGWYQAPLFLNPRRALIGLRISL